MTQVVKECVCVRVLKTLCLSELKSLTSAFKMIHLSVAFCQDDPSFSTWSKNVCAGAVNIIFELKSLTNAIKVMHLSVEFCQDDSGGQRMCV